MDLGAAKLRFLSVFYRRNVGKAEIFLCQYAMLLDDPEKEQHKSHELEVIETQLLGQYVAFPQPLNVFTHPVIAGGVLVPSCRCTSGTPCLSPVCHRHRGIERDRRNSR